MKVFYFWLDWKGQNLALIRFRESRTVAQAWFDALQMNGPASLSHYHLLEIQDNSAVALGVPTSDQVSGLSLIKRAGTWLITIMNNDVTDSEQLMLQKEFEIAFKGALPDSRDTDGVSWRDRPMLF